MSVVHGVPYLESVDAKLARAHHHLDAIDGHIQQFLDSTTDNFVPKVNPETNQSLLVWRISEPYHPPLSVSVEIGEFLYNLRSALDNLVCALIRTHKRTSSCAGRGFPIHTDCNKFNIDAPRMLKDVPVGARTLIQGLQPYSRGQETAPIDPLNILNQLRNRDTHRALNLAAMYNKDTRLVLRDAVTERLIVYAVLPRTIHLWNEAETVPLPIPATDMPEQVKVKALGQRGMAFLEDGPWGERDVREILVACLQYVEERVIARFKPFFDQSSHI